MDELVSIVMPIYNNAEYVSRAVESVLAQTYTQYEILIADDCSIDGSREIVKEWSKRDNRIKVFDLPVNSGPAAARNLCIQNACGRYIAFLDSDDLWCQNKLARQIEFMLEKDCVLSCTAYQRIDENGNAYGRMIKVPPVGNYEQLLCTNHIGNSTAIYDSKKLGKLAIPNAKREDYGLWLKILRAGHKVYGLDECLMLYRVHGKSSSKSKLKMAYQQWQVYRQTEKLPLFRSIVYFFQYAYCGYMKSRY
jgi:teichuronic acid biosynthesis glycosyltransferase TuaG